MPRDLLRGPGHPLLKRIASVLEIALLPRLFEELPERVYLETERVASEVGPYLPVGALRPVPEREPGLQAGVVLVPGLDHHEKRIELPLLPVLLPGSDLVGDEHVRNPSMKAEGEVELYVDLAVAGRAWKPCGGLGQQGIEERIHVFLPARGAYKVLLNSLNGHVPLRQERVFITDIIPLPKEGVKHVGDYVQERVGHVHDAT